MVAMTATHEVTNQPPPLVDYDVFSADRTLGEAVERYGAGGPRETLRELGAKAGSAEAQRWADEANRYPPILRTHDRYGHRIDEVEYHPSYHDLMRTAIGHGLHAAPWADSRPGAHVARAAGFYVWSQTDAGHGCPISMTYAAVPALKASGVDPAIAEAWLPRLGALTLRPRAAPRQDLAIAGMAMTEKQGGSDVRAGTTRALPDGDPGTLRPHRPQVVLLGADERPVPGARASAGRLVLLPGAPGPARRQPESLLSPAFEGQARQPLERLQ